MFSEMGGVAVSHMAKWDGTSWSPLGSGTDGPVAALRVFELGSGPALLAGGTFTTAGGVAANRVATWSSSGWSAFGPALNGTVYTVSMFNEGAGGTLFVGGDQFNVGGVSANLVRGDGGPWEKPSGVAGGRGLLGPVNVMLPHGTGGGELLYVGGEFPSADGVDSAYVAVWDGSQWTSLGTGMSYHVNALAVFDEGSGPNLFAAGGFAQAGGVPARYIARWDGVAWSPVGAASGAEVPVYALAVFDDGTGPVLYAAGGFNTMGGVPVDSVAKWDGSAWSAVGAGFEGVPDTVRTLTVFDDGTGPALYAGGDFRVAGHPLERNVARWDGAEWTPVGGGTNGQVVTSTVFDDGDGPALYVGGFFSQAGGQPAARVAKWDGAAWSGLGLGVNAYVSALAVYDEGLGPRLYVGGAFTEAGGRPASRVARWNGSNWSILGAGVENNFLAVNALAPFDDGSGPTLFVGGGFFAAGGEAASNVAKFSYSCFEDQGPIFIDGFESGDTSRWDSP
ncbi:MAG: hypothetical protein AAGM22_12680 [Acidobacteriota bacterium]